MDNRIDNIYIYVWEEFSTVYIGRTKNPKSRHYAHRHRETESTYKFSSEHHVEHPPMIILESDLTVSDGAEREKYWIEFYKETTGYNVLNKSRGGQLGRIPVYTEEERKKHRKQYEATHKDEIRKRAQEYYRAHREEKLAKVKEYREKHHDEIREREKEYYVEKTREQKKSREILKKILKVEHETLKEIQKKRDVKKKELRSIINAEKHKEYCRNYYLSHRKSSKPYKSGAKFDHKEYYRKHREELLAKQKEYNRRIREENKEEAKAKQREYMRQYRLSKKNIKNVN